jgi:hypothetical protein
MKPYVDSFALNFKKSDRTISCACGADGTIRIYFLYEEDEANEKDEVLVYTGTLPSDFGQLMEMTYNWLTLDECQIVMKVVDVVAS